MTLNICPVVVVGNGILTASFLFNPSCFVWGQMKSVGSNSTVFDPFFLSMFNHI